MKTFEECNYYEMLKIPADADLEDIRFAYRDALAIYDGDSLATYSLFSDEQRADLLNCIEKAFATLSVGSKRAAYNQTLIQSGKAELHDFSLAGQRQLAGGYSASAPSKQESIRWWVRKKSAEKENIKMRRNLLAQETISGCDLKAYRQAMGIEISEMNTVTKISATVLQAIEKNQYNTLPAKFYLKRFLQSYAEILQLDPGHISTAYLKRMNGSGN